MWPATLIQRRSEQTQRTSAWILFGNRAFGLLPPRSSIAATIPYLVALILPGGSILAIALWIYRRLRGAPVRTVAIRCGLSQISAPARHVP